MRTTNKNARPHLIVSIALLLASLAAQADIPAGYTVLETIIYEYDEAGNRIAKGATVTGTSETPIEAQYDTGNRLTQLALKGQGTNGTDLACTLAYDPNGNLSTKTCGTETTQYTWDGRNRLAGLQSPTVNASFQYDALGRRIERTVNGDTLQYLYDGNQAIAELRNGAVSAHILTGLAIDEAIARYTTEGERTLLTDALGSVFIAAKEDSTVATAYGYSAYGETQVMGTDEHNPIQYTARENDGTGLYFYRARYYDPQLKRFISEDPIGINGGLNVYAYVGGNPLGNRDPSGLSTLIEVLPIAGGAAASDGPLPIGDIVAGVIIVGAAIYDMCKAKEAPCKLHSQNRIGLAPGKIRCTYLCKLDTGGRGFVTRIQNGNSCAAETDWVEGDWGF